MASGSLLALLAFVAWTVTLLLAVGLSRVAKVAAGKARPGDFPAGVPHGADTYWRLNRAHLNCLEFLPLFGAVVIVGAVADVESAAFETGAWVVVAARVGQSLVHVASGSDLAVNLRFGFFLVQVATLITMGIVAAGLA